MPIFVVSRRPWSAAWPGWPSAALAALWSGITRPDPAVADLLPQQGLDLGERALLRYARDVVGAGQRHPGHGRGLDRQRAQVLRLQAVHVGLAARPGQHLRLEGERVQEVVDALGRLIDLEPLAQLRVLGGDADRAAPGVAVVALAGRDADRALVVGDAGDLLVAVERHQR